MSDKLTLENIDTATIAILEQYIRINFTKIKQKILLKELTEPSPQPDDSAWDDDAPADSAATLPTAEEYRQSLIKAIKEDSKFLEQNEAKSKKSSQDLSIEEQTKLLKDKIQQAKLEQQQHYQDISLLREEIQRIKRKIASYKTQHSSQATTNSKAINTLIDKLLQEKVKASTTATNDGRSALFAAINQGISLNTVVKPEAQARPQPLDGQASLLDSIRKGITLRSSTTDGNKQNKVTATSSETNLTLLETSLAHLLENNKKHPETKDKLIKQLYELTIELEMWENPEFQATLTQNLERQQQLIKWLEEKRKLLTNLQQQITTAKNKIVALKDEANTLSTPEPSIIEDIPAVDTIPTPPPMPGTIPPPMPGTIPPPPPMPKQSKKQPTVIGSNSSSDKPTTPQTTKAPNAVNLTAELRRKLQSRRVNIIDDDGDEEQITELRRLEQAQILQQQQEQEQQRLSIQTAHDEAIKLLYAKLNVIEPNIIATQEAIKAFMAKMHNDLPGQDSLSIITIEATIKQLQKQLDSLITEQESLIQQITTLKETKKPSEIIDRTKTQEVPPTDASENEIITFYLQNILTIFIQGIQSEITRLKQNNPTENSTTWQQLQKLTALDTELKQLQQEINSAKTSNSSVNPSNKALSKEQLSTYTDRLHNIITKTEQQLFSGKFQRFLHKIKLIVGNMINFIKADTINVSQTIAKTTIKRNLIFNTLTNSLKQLKDLSTNISIKQKPN